MSANVTRVTIARLFNLGSYEHVRYEITVDIHPEELSASSTLIGLEKIMEALAPESKWVCLTEGELEREEHRVKELQEKLATLSEEEFKHKYGWFEGTGAEYVERCAEMHGENIKRRRKAVERAKTARMLLDNLGGASQWKDCKMDWQDELD